MDVFGPEMTILRTEEEAAGGPHPVGTLRKRENSRWATAHPTSWTPLDPLTAIQYGLILNIDVY
jgi:hypothetical protein